MTCTNNMVKVAKIKDSGESKEGFLIKKVAKDLFLFLA